MEVYACTEYPGILNLVTDVNSFPQFCHDTGLTCEACTENTARSLALVCLGLAGRQVGPMFVQLYPDPACAPMHGHFTSAYRAAAGTEACWEEAPRRGLVREMPRTLVAVA